MTPPSTDRPLWQSAASFAARAHRHQVRKDGDTPYVSHAFRVAMTVRDLFGCEDGVALASALLHDVIEDTDVDYDEVREAFGDEVARTVAALTKNGALPEHEREQSYDAGLARADWRARLVKLADAYDNLCDSRDRGQENIKKIIAKCRRAIALAREDAPSHPITRRAIERLEALIQSHA